MNDEIRGAVDPTEPWSAPAGESSEAGAQAAGLAAEMAAALSTFAERADVEARRSPTDATEDGDPSSPEPPVVAAREPGEFVAVADLPQPAPAMLVPRPGVHPAVDRLAQANAAARDASLARLAEDFPGYDFGEAAQTTDDRRFSLLVIGDALHKRLDALAAVDRVLATHDLRPGRFRLAHGDVEDGRRFAGVTRPIQPGRPTERVSVGALLAALRHRWTGIVNGIDDCDEAAGRLCEHLERAYGCRVNINVYLSVGLAEGFGDHWDQHDTIIVPTHGTKRWEVYEPSVLSPLRPWIKPDVSGRPVWTGELSPGMAMVIPRGWGHRPLGSDDLAIHYTIGINRFRVHELLNRLEHEAGYWPLMRADLPFDPDGEIHSYGGSLFDGPDALGELFAELTTPELVGRAVATYRARMPARLFPSLVDGWWASERGDWEGLRLRLSAPGGLMAVGADAGAVTVAAANRLVRVRNAAFEAFCALAEGRPVEVDALAAVTAADGTDGRATMLRELIELGLVQAEAV